MTSENLITVCLSAYNAERFLARAIESVLAQTYTNFRLIVVNDASTDGTLPIVKTFLTDPRVCVIDLKKNIGTYAAKNLVLKNFADGDYWAHHDADDYSEPTRFERQLHYLHTHDLDGCGTAVDEIYETGIEPQIPSAEPLQIGEDGLRHRINQYPNRVTLDTISVDIERLAKLKIFMNGTPLFRMDALKELGGFDGRTYTGADSDLLWRWVLRYSFGNMSEVLYHRRFHAESLTQSRATGWQSPRRKEYAARALARHEERFTFVMGGKGEEAWKKAVEDMYYPDVPFTILGNTTV